MFDSFTHLQALKKNVSQQNNPITQADSDSSILDSSSEEDAESANSKPNYKLVLKDTRITADTSRKPSDSTSFRKPSDLKEDTELSPLPSDITSNSSSQDFGQPQRGLRKVKSSN